MDDKEEIKEEVCEGCGGTGKIIYPAHQQAGEIIDEREEDCSLCNKTKPEEDEN